MKITSSFSLLTIGFILVCISNFMHLQTISGLRDRNNKLEASLREELDKHVDTATKYRDEARAHRDTAIKRMKEAEQALQMQRDFNAYVATHP